MGSLRKSWAIAATIVAVSLSGCTSVRSTYFHRDDEDTEWRKKHIKGIPITLRVPTHVKIDILETVYHDGTSFLMLDKDNILKTRGIATNYITEAKIFGVDFKRPAAGPYKFIANMSTNNPQYFGDVDQELTDETIQRVGEAINGLVKALVPKGIPLGKAQSAGAVTPTDAQPLTTIACSRVFKIDAPDFEQQVALFLQSNCCDDSRVPLIAETPHIHAHGAAAPSSVSTLGRQPGAGGVIRASATVVRDTSDSGSHQLSASR